MTAFIALFRGINVGGRNVLKMKDLRKLMAELGLDEVRTYIQSGNAVFEADAACSADLVQKLRSEILAHHGFSPELVLLDGSSLERAIARNPFPEASAEPATVHLTFLSSTPEAPDLDALEGVRSASERFALIGSVFYLHAPEGIARSKLAAKTEKALGVPGTSRNWRTVLKLQEMLG